MADDNNGGGMGSILGPLGAAGGLFAWLKSRNQAKQAEADREKAETERRRAETEKAKVHEQEESEQLKILTARLAVTEQRSTTLEARVDAQSAKIIRLEIEKTDLLKKISKIEDANETQQEKMQQLEQQNADLVVELDRANAHITELHKLFEGLGQTAPARPAVKPNPPTKPPGRKKS